MSSFSSNVSDSQSGIIVNFITSIFNVDNIDLLTHIIRKLAHFTEYLVLGLLMYNLVKDKRNNIILALFICVIYAISDEIHQIYVPGRSGQITDIFIDSVGSICGILIYKGKHLFDK